MTSESDGDRVIADPPVFIRDFYKSYGETRAVRGVTFQVQAGCVLGLVGPNGAGKTTIMRCACGILPPTSGELRIAGHEVAREPVAAKRELAYVPDEPHLFDSLTVWEHLRFTASAYRLEHWEARGEELLRRFELIQNRETLALELSRGMRQKVAICCAYLHEPRAIWFDEPLTGLDPRGIRTMKDSIHERAAKGAAVIISSHLLSLVEGICTHLLILHRGQLLFFGSMDDARSAMRLAGDSSLEDLFFRLTEAGTRVDATPPPALSPTATSTSSVQAHRDART